MLSRSAERPQPTLTRAIPWTCLTERETQESSLGAAVAPHSMIQTHRLSSLVDRHSVDGEHGNTEDALHAFSVSDNVAFCLLSDAACVYTSCSIRSSVT